MNNFLCLPPVKLHCSMLAEDAIKAVVEDNKKNDNANEKFSMFINSV